MLTSQICKSQDFTTPWFHEAYFKLKESFAYHRKLWEFCYIYEALRERNMLGWGKRGLGFGVGKEPLVSLFASHGCSITATDLDYSSASAQGWVDSNQHSYSIQQLNERGICDPARFQQLVNFETLNMNFIGDQYANMYDFTWSSCSFEHLGSIELGKRFIIEQMKCLKPGGIAVHTTEFNLSSNDHTMESGTTVIFRLQDIEWMRQTLLSLGHAIEMDYNQGAGPVDLYIDVPPYKHNPHLRLLLGQYVTTSIGLIIRKA